MNHQYLRKHIASGILLGAALMLLAVPVTSRAALDANMYVIGSGQGQIEGEVTTLGREGSILVVGYGYNLSAEYNPATGLKSGKRQHRPVRIIKLIDQASPLLFNAMVNNENLINVTITFWRLSEGGQPQQYYTVTLTNAQIVGITPSHSSAPEDAADPATETISFTYQTITTVYEPTGVAGFDSWSSPTD